MTTIGLIRIDLELQSAGGVSAPELDNIAVDLPLSRRRGEPRPDGTGSDEVWVPPTSLAGSLRAHAGDEAERWFGSAPPAGGRAGNERRLEPSRVRFLGSQTTLPGSSAVRCSTAIDPCRGSAAASTLRSREVAPAGTTVSLFLRLDQPGTDDLDEFARLLVTWHPIIGRGRSTGHGQATLTRVAWRTLDLRTTAGLRWWLTAGRDGLFPGGDGWDQVCTPTAPQAPEPEFDLRFTIVGALHLGAGSTTSQDGRTRNSIEQEGGAPLLPGTAWKGLLRSRCGYILRSCGHAACLAPAEFSCGVCILCDLFGWTAEGGQAGTAIGRVGRLITHDSVIDGEVTYRNHVGIDRFTGGARRALLFSDEVVAEGHLSLRVDVTDLGDRGTPARLTPAERGLLLHAVRDLHDGLIGVGHATTRGYGSVRLTDDSATVLGELAPSHPTGAAVLALLRGEAA